MSNAEKWKLSFMIWIAVYPSVLVLTYMFDILGIDWPKWAKLIVTTAFTVPFIEFVVTPIAQRAVAMGRGQTRAELMLDEARKAAGPDPKDEALRMPEREEGRDYYATDRGSQRTGVEGAKHGKPDTERVEREEARDDGHGLPASA